MEEKYIKRINFKRNKETIKKYNYPPEYRENTVEDVIKQAEFMMSE
ncbi:MAG: DUF3387 domain-containing protein [Gammaproteobacteria bacterium]|nr:DUF3387 domain-containing protein [Gammaproteobacteria bacterium]